jgi:hypothetical protein
MDGLETGMTENHSAASKSSPTKYWVIALLIIGSTAGYVSIPTYTHKCGSGPGNDAYLNLYRLYDAQVQYFQAQGSRFVGTVKLTPGNPTQLMCDGGDHEGFVTDEKTWAVPAWKALNFSVLERTHYAYEIQTSGTGLNAQFIIRALGDLDCDGIRSTFEVTGRVDPKDASKIIGRHAIFSRNSGE